MRKKNKKEIDIEKLIRLKAFRQYMNDKGKTVEELEQERLEWQLTLSAEEQLLFCGNVKILLNELGH